ncbi:MAG: sulfite exporter TauE/SafE family protein [Synergistaceae bacterium]|nr:sulfite exporter TauE/SafE family protein [Synergistaceae bacterium]
MYFYWSEVEVFLKNAYYLAYLPSLDQDVGYGILLLFGFLTSLHCVGMCGGLILTQTLNSAGEHKDRGEGSTDKTHLFYPGIYNAGRIFSYTLVGALAGGLGQTLTFSGRLTGAVPLIGGVFMLLLGINLLGISPFLRKISLPMPKWLAKLLYKGTLKGKNPFLIGSLTSLMPCGPLQIVQVYAISTKSVLVGAASMLTFVLGTVPALYLFGAFGGLFGKRFSHLVTKGSAVVVCIMGFLMVGRGLALSGVQWPMAALTEDSGDFITSVMVGDSQCLTTEFEAYSYPPIWVKAGIPVVWTILVTEENYNSCNNSIELPAFGLKTDLDMGKTVVTFTPDKEGDFVYTCWMGMITSTIRVTAK